VHVRILGSRGIPAQHGGFETFAEQLALYLVSRGHQVTVYCQTEDPAEAGEDVWRGVNRVMIYAQPSPYGTVSFDFRAAWHALWRGGVILTLGYNTAVFSLLYTLRGRKSVMNMDGLEWKREKWSRLERLWLRLNELAGAKLSTHLIADHPEIGRHLRKFVPPSKISVIPYGAAPVMEADHEVLRQWNCEPNRYALCVARPEPDNSILAIVRAFSKEPRGYPLLVLGTLHEKNAYHQAVRENASEEVIFPGPIYARSQVNALRFSARVYLHGHRVGGTNPSLVEAMAAGSPVVAHENPFNKGVAGPEAKYFSSEEELAEILTLLGDAPEELESMRRASFNRHAEAFGLERTHLAYEELLEKFCSDSCVEEEESLVSSPSL
jgi:glycosyltransferase involved in cell wall biosynthesis